MTFNEELVRILKEELNILYILKELTYEKTDIIINNEVENLEKITKKEEELINKMGIAEKNRLQLMDSWGVDIKTPLTQVIEKVSEGKDELIEIKDKLVSSLDDIRRRNNINNELIKDNLQWLDFNMNLISNIQTPTTYGKKDKETGPNSSLFDRKV